MRYESYLPFNAYMHYRHPCDHTPTQNLLIYECKTVTHIHRLHQLHTNIKKLQLAKYQPSISTKLIQDVSTPLFSVYVCIVWQNFGVHCFYLRFRNLNPRKNLDGISHASESQYETGSKVSICLLKKKYRDLPTWDLARESSRTPNDSRKL